MRESQNSAATCKANGICWTSFQYLALGTFLDMFSAVRYRKTEHSKSNLAKRQNNVRLPIIFKTIVWPNPTNNIKAFRRVPCNFSDLFKTEKLGFFLEGVGEMAEENLAKKFKEWAKIKKIEII